MYILKTVTLGSFFSAAILSISMAQAAPPFPVPQPPPFELITDDVLIVSDKVDDVSKILTEEQQQLNEIESKVDLILKGIRVQVSVNELLCLSFNVAGACVEEFGHFTGEGATSGNHNPIRVIVSLTHPDGSPVLPTTPTNLTWEYGGLGDTGAALVTAICGSARDNTLGCRTNDPGVTGIGNGTFVFDVHPSQPGANWDVGGGHFTVKVTDHEGHVGVGIGKIVIPAGE